MLCWGAEGYATAHAGGRMNLFGVMEASGSAMQAERMRAEVVAANMANAETTRTADGTPYRRQHVVFAANGGGNLGQSASFGQAPSFAQSLMPQMPALLANDNAAQPAG